MANWIYEMVYNDLSEIPTKSFSMVSGRSNMLRTNYHSYFRTHKEFQVWLNSLKASGKAEIILAYERQLHAYENVEDFIAKSSPKMQELI